MKSCYELADGEYKKLLSHVSTRWLSLYKAVDRLLENLEPLRNYFIGVSASDLPIIITDFLFENCGNNITDGELYLIFVHQYMEMFQTSILDLEKSSTNSTKLYTVMKRLRDRLNGRITARFFSKKLNDTLEKLPEERRSKFEKEEMSAYKISLKYLEDWFNFETSVFKKLSCLDLFEKLDYRKVCAVVSDLRIQVNHDHLLDECVTFNNIWERFSEEEKKENMATWVKVLTTTRDEPFPNLTLIMESVFAIPTGNDAVERVFSVMNSLMSSERSGMSTELIKAEICVFSNFKYSCSSFYDYAIKNRRILEAAKGKKKYKRRSFKNK